MRRDVAALVVLGGIALLGNGLKAVVTSTVLVSEAQFAAFLGIAVDRVALLMETIVAGMVVALAVYPLMLHRFPVRSVAIAACALAVAAFAAFAAVSFAHSLPWQREFAAYACLTLGAAALVCLAPSAQALITQWPAAAGRKVLTTVWTGATPAGFLAAPQLANWLLPALGLSAYFAAFATLPLLQLALVAMAAAVLRAPAGPGLLGATLPRPLLASFIVAVIAFEVWSTLGSIAGYLALATLAALPLLAAAIAWLARCAAGLPEAGTADRATWWLLGALFVLEVPTTGFFEAAFLFGRHLPAAFVADRATLSAASQILGTLAAGLLIHRNAPAAAPPFAAFALVTIGGLITFAGYPWARDPAYFLWTAVVTGFGTGGLTLLLCVGIVRDATRAPILAALPSIAIMIGTEVGLEALQCVLAAAKGMGLDTPDAFRLLFAAQVAAGAAVLPLVLRARRYG